jgi:hypothetical protein
MPQDAASGCVTNAVPPLPPNTPPLLPQDLVRACCPQMLPRICAAPSASLCRPRWCLQSRPRPLPGKCPRRCPGPYPQNAVLGCGPQMLPPSLPPPPPRCCCYAANGIVPGCCTTAAPKCTHDGAPKCHSFAAHEGCPRMLPPEPCRAAALCRPQMPPLTLFLWCRCAIHFCPQIAPLNVGPGVPSLLSPICHGMHPKCTPAMLPPDAVPVPPSNAIPLLSPAAH